MFSSLLILGILGLFLLLALLFDEDLEIIKPVLAESDDESDSVKRNKGKGKAHESDYVDLTPLPHSSDDEIAIDKTNFELKKQQEDHDYKLAQKLQNEEYINESDLDSRSSYTVYSSEIHTDHSENTVNKKLSVLEYNNDESNKRKHESGSDNENPKSKKRKIFPLK